MCSRFAPENGADSAPIDTLDRGCQTPGCWATYVVGESHECIVPRPWKVVMEDPTDDRITVLVPAAIGPHDAMNQARDLRPGYYALKAFRVAA
jgi:hypothetical protein